MPDTFVASTPGQQAARAAAYAMPLADIDPSDLDLFEKEIGRAHV